MKRFLRSIAQNPKTLATLVEEHKVQTHTILFFVLTARRSGYAVTTHMSSPTTYEWTPPA